MSPLKNIFLAALIVFTSSFVSHERLYPETLDWNTHFKASAEFNSPYAAVTSTIWHYSYTATIRNNNLHIAFNFIGGVDANKSWVNRSKIRDRSASSTLLNHEQGHVYINFLLLKNGETIIRNQNYTTSNYKRLVDKTAKEVSKFYNDMQERYDLETKHGSDVVAQERWDLFFANELSL